MPKGPLAAQVNQQQPLLANNPPSHIWYADAPDKAERKITIPEFMALYKGKGGAPFEYTNTVWASYADRICAQLQTANPEILARQGQLKEMLLNPLLTSERARVVYIDDKVGHGVILREPIKCNDIVVVYSGRMLSALTEYDSIGEYALGGSAACVGAAVDSADKGNWSRFLQDAPMSLMTLYNYHRYLRTHKLNTLLEMVFAPPFQRDFANVREFATFWCKINEGIKHINDIEGDVPDVVTANLTDVEYIVDGYPVVVFRAMCDIAAETPLVFDYGAAYWRDKGFFPQLFLTSGKSSEQAFNMCGNCLSVKLQAEFRRCPCHMVYYCDPVCQKQHWKAAHKDICPKNKSKDSKRT